MPTASDTLRGDAMIADYFRSETRLLSERCLAEIRTLDDWTSRRDDYRRQLFEMLGLRPDRERTELRAVTTGKIEHAAFHVERVHFQSSPGLYVTGDLYLPASQDAPSPGILYVCGHSSCVIDGVSYGAKAQYQNHGAWFARNGYVCLVLDTLQLGEIEGLHHGIYYKNLWHWYALGYTPAGVEAWNGIRALDYLQSRPEVDPNRLGMTGRSGGGATSWWVSALDERIGAAVPVAGITDLENHVVDGCVEGHCDCMFMTNAYRWDFPMVAALIAPRPLLIGNTDKDGIFPLDGVQRLHEKVRRIYRLCGAADKLGLLITEGDHIDTQDIQIPAMRWFNRFLKGEGAPVENYPVSFFAPQELKVFDRLPADEINTTIADSFVALPPAPPLPDSPEDWRAMKERWLEELRTKTFGGWPAETGAPEVRPAFSTESDGLIGSAYDFESQPTISLRLHIVRPADDLPERATLRILSEGEWDGWAAAMKAGFPETPDDAFAVEPDAAAFAALRSRIVGSRETMAWIAPRGIGPTAWNPDEKKRTQIRRRFMLLGQTLAGMRVWDARRAIQALRSLHGMKRIPLSLEGDGEAAVLALYAGIFESGLDEIRLRRPSATHREGPDLLNVLRVFDLPQAVAVAADGVKIRLLETDAAAWDYPARVAERLSWSEDRFQRA